MADGHSQAVFVVRLVRMTGASPFKISCPYVEFEPQVLVTIVTLNRHSIDFK